MGKLSVLAAQIEGAQPISAADLPDDLARRHAATADAIRAAGVPDRLNRYLTASPVEIAAGKDRIARHVKAGRERHVIPPASRSEPMKKMGPKEQALRDLRKQATTTTPKATAPAPTEPPTAQPEAQAKETTVRTNTAAKTTARPKVAKTRIGKAGNKLDLVQRMLTSKTGATRESLSKATGWPYVNLKLSAERAKMKLVEEAGRFRLVPLG